MMKNSLVFFFLSFSFFCCKAQTKLTAEELNAQTAVITVFQALADRDFHKMSRNCTADLQVYENGVIWNLDTLKQKINLTKSIPDFLRINTLDFIATRIKGKVGWITYYNQAEVTRNGQHGFVKWLETAILLKEDSGWKMQTLHSTLLQRN